MDYLDKAKRALEAEKDEKIKNFLLQRLRDIDRIDQSVKAKEKELEKFKKFSQDAIEIIRESIDKVDLGDTEEVFSQHVNMYVTPSSMAY